MPTLHKYQCSFTIISRLILFRTRNVSDKNFKENQNTFYRGADKSLAQPGRKQATATEDFDFHISYL
jgi:hypothetical protein